MNQSFSFINNFTPNDQQLKAEQVNTSRLRIPLPQPNLLPVLDQVNQGQFDNDMTPPSQNRFSSAINQFK